MALAQFSTNESEEYGGGGLRVRREGGAWGNLSPPRLPEACLGHVLACREAKPHG